MVKLHFDWRFTLIENGLCPEGHALSSITVLCVSVHTVVARMGGHHLTPAPEGEDVPAGIILQCTGREVVKLQGMIKSPVNVL